MKPSHRSTGKRVLLGIAGLLTFGSGGCIPSTDGGPPISREVLNVRLEQSIEVADAPPGELLAVIQKASGELAALTAESAAGRNRSPRLHEIKRQVFTGIKAADKLLSHPDADEQARKTALTMKLMFLYDGVCSDATLGPRLQQFVEQLVEEHPGSEEAALASACLLQWRYLSRRAAKEDVLPRLVDYARAYPDSPAGVELFRLYAEKLESQSDNDGAKECYRQAVSLYGQRPEVQPLGRRLRELEGAEARSAARRTQLRQANEARIAAIKRKLGGQRDGYFVIYAEENVKPPRHGGMYFYRYEYEVLHGVNAAVAYVQGLSEKYSWRLVRRFAESTIGREQAYELWKQRLRKKRTGKD